MTAEDPHLDQELNKIYTMIGLRDHQRPDEMEYVFLAKWIKANYGALSVRELSYAFELAMQNRLDLDDVKHYGHFSIQYLSEIMNSYQRLKSYIRKNLNPQPLEIKSLPAPVLTLEDKKKEVDDFAARCSLPLSLLPLYIYDYLEELGLIPMTPQDVERRAKAAPEIRLNQIFKDATDNKDARFELKDYKEQLASGSLSEKEKGYLLRIEKRIAIFDYVKAYREQLKSKQ